MEEMKTFECAICGKAHTNLEDRINCEMSCLKEQKVLEKKQAEENKQKAKQLAKEKLDEAISELAIKYVSVFEQFLEYNKEYGDYEIEVEDSTPTDFFMKGLLNFIF